jgi:hypothetical protein
MWVGKNYFIQCVLIGSVFCRWISFKKLKSPHFFRLQKQFQRLKTKIWIQLVNIELLNVELPNVELPNVKLLNIEILNVELPNVKTYRTVKLTE